METTKLVYEYDEVTGEFIGTTYAHLCQVTKNDWIYPANTTTIAPIPQEPNKAVVFSENAWSLKEDNRGKELFVKETAESVGVIYALGPIPDGLTDKPPCEFPLWDGDGWVVDKEKEAAASLADAANNEALKKVVGLTRTIHGDVDSSYASDRISEYPPIGDQLDAIMKWLATETEFTVPQELKSIAMACMAVKSRHPKTEE